MQDIWKATGWNGAQWTKSWEYGLVLTEVHNVGHLIGHWTKGCEYRFVLTEVHNAWHSKGHWTKGCEYGFVLINWSALFRTLERPWTERHSLNRGQTWSAHTSRHVWHVKKLRIYVRLNQVSQCRTLERPLNKKLNKKLWIWVRLN